MKPFVRSAHNYDMNAASAASGTVNNLPSRTIQADAADTDINVIVARFGVTGLVPSVPMPPLEADFEDVFDFQSAQNLIRRSTEAFNVLPAEVRSRFSNDPGLFVDFCSQTLPNGSLANLEEMRKMGLAVPPAPAIIPPEPLAVRVVPDPPPKGST